MSFTNPVLLIIILALLPAGSALPPLQAQEIP